MKKMTKDYFASLVGDAYDDYGYRKSTLTINSAAYEQIGEYFHDDDLLLEEWLHCQNCREPFVIHEEDEFGDELIFEIRTGEELFDYFENMRPEAERGIRKFRNKLNKSSFCVEKALIYGLFSAKTTLNQRFLRY